MLQEVDQFALVDVGVVIFIEVFECLANSTPLLPNFLNELGQIVTISHACCSCQLLVVALAPFLLLQVALILRVLLRIVSKDEAGQIMNLITHPSTKVIVVQHACAICLRVDTFHDLNQIAILYRDVSSIECYDVFRLNEAVMVLIDGQKRFIH